MIHKDKKTAYLLLFVCAMTNLSQMPVFVELGITRFFSIPVWIVLAAQCLLHNNWVIRFKTVTVPIVLACIFAVYYMAVSLFIPQYSMALPSQVFMSIFILAVSVMTGDELQDEDIYKVFTTYIVTGLVVCVNVFISYIYGNSLEGFDYLYDSKNSVSQILLTVWTLIILYKFKGQTKLKIVGYAIALMFVTYCMLALKSRATLIAMPLVVLLILCNGKSHKAARRVALALTAVAIVLLLNDDIYNTVVNEILLAGRGTEDMNMITSGRADEWKTFWSDWDGYELFGQGRRKRESIILTALLEFGIVGGGIILVLAVYPIYWGIQYLKKTNPFYLCFMIIAVVYFVNGIFEQLAPFGPGVKCYFLWMMLGLLSARQANAPSLKSSAMI